MKQILQACKYYVVLYYSGDRIFNLLKKKNPYKNSKYYIKKMYSDDTLKDYSQKIKILLPTISDEPYEEYLVNEQFLEHLLGKVLYNKPAI